MPFPKKTTVPATSAAPAPGGFKRGAGKPSPAAAAKAAPAKARAKSRWAGVTAARVQFPIIGEGRYRVRITANDFLDGAGAGGGADHVKGTFEIVAAADGSTDKEGDVRVNLEGLGYKGFPGEGRWKSYVMFSSGYETEAEYDAFDPDGAYLEALLGEENDYSAAGLTNVGRLVDLTVTRGKATENGDYFRNYAWEVVSEEEQESEGGAPRPEIPE